MRGLDPGEFGRVRSSPEGRRQAPEPDPREGRHEALILPREDKFSVAAAIGSRSRLFGGGNDLLWQNFVVVWRGPAERDGIEARVEARRGDVPAIGLQGMCCLRRVPGLRAAVEALVELPLWGDRRPSIWRS